ncbi:type III secretion system export apparatus subunit SctV [Shewanella sp. VB17]|uniref:type III secretion system export apparatus subunit SctV n=1 Tax=Shewanella sp. VB17 TaxID=2739432 RepID=UPI0015638A06|nr:type III secretion system export apparatus subunit SctV [Shewanella sp. VB17]NRD71750.1 type III secretion system export apparatus subunit SctV [Shewanella sp. VB17]
MNKLINVLNLVSQRKDIMLAVLLLGVIFMMILPLPTALVDVLIGINITIAVVLMMLAIYIKSPLEFSAFPVVLLITTIFRLSLSITTTRLILLQADAGQIVYTFGNFVVGGNLIVGLVIFLIITIVQFLVITKGSERVAEVSARFSLDAMPGKQMSIDGDMRAGVIDVHEARERRSVIEKESQMYGSMDGAMKFVKGDAIAGLVIIFVNILGGVTIGVTQKGMSAADALQLFSVLTIGDGLVSQIPALLIAITAGMIVTRVDNNENASDMGSEIGDQVTAQPRALMIGGALLILFAFIPGFPTGTFLILALVVGGGGVLISFNAKKLIMSKNDDLPSFLANGAGAPAAKPKNSSIQNNGNKLGSKEEFALTVPLMIDIDASLQSHLEAISFNDELVRVRRALYLDLGVPFPGIHLRFNASLDNQQYVIHLQEVPVARGRIMKEKLLVTEGSEQIELLNISYDRGENFLPNIDTIWVSDSKRETLDKSRIGFLTADRILTYHLSHVLKEYAEDFVGIQETRYLLEEMDASYGELVKEAQRMVPLQKMTEIMQRLVSEDISIRNLRTILEAMVEWGQKEKDVVQLTEYIRTSLKRYICYKYSNGQNVLPAYLLEQQLEETIRNGVRQTSAGSYLALDPSVTQEFLSQVKQTVGELSQMNNKPVMVVSMDIRRYVRKLIEADYYDLPVLSFQELTQQINIQPLGRVGM